MSLKPCVHTHAVRHHSCRSDVVYLGLDVCEQHVGAAHLQQHVLTPHASHLVQQVQPLDAVGHASQLLPVQVTAEQVLRHRGSKHNVNLDVTPSGSCLCGKR